jgi:Peptidase family M23
MPVTRCMPLKAGTYRLSSPFGPRDRRMHRGQDFAANDGTPIYAAQAGSVQYIGAAQGFGQWIVIDHPAPAGGGTTVYGHMWDAFATGLKPGSSVAPVSTLPMWEATANPPAHICTSKCTPQSGGRALKLIPCRGWRARWIRERWPRSRRSR